MEGDTNLEFPSNSDSLYPALFQCFTIILCGYIAGVLNLVSQTESKGIGTFVGTFALPSLIFLSLARLDFSTVNWTFLLAILLAKGIIFFAVIIVTILVSKPTHLGRSGIFAIFCTQSNDFALGYPIISAIYSQTHPEYALYLYLMAPISLAILNPVAFVLMEINKQKEMAQSQPLTESQRKSDVCKLKLVRQIVKGIAFNPVLVMTILGIVGNILFKHYLSVYIEGLLEVFGQAFSGTALFLLGLRMVGQVHRLRGPALLLPCVLIMVKLIILPLMMRESVSLLNSGANESDTLSLSTYAFLYGTIPTAPAVFVFSNSYQLEMDLMASSMVVCTLLSAPMMFLSAQLITISKDFADQLRRFGFDLSIASLVAAAWVLLVFVATKKYKRMPHRLTMCLLVSQVLLAASVVWGGPAGAPPPPLLQQALRLFGMYSCLLWTAMLSVGVLMLESRGPCCVVALWPVLGFVAWGAPGVMVAVLLASRNQDGDLDSRAAGPIRLCLLVFCLTVSAGCLIVYTRFRRRSAQAVAPPAQDAAGQDLGEATTLVDNAEPISQSQSLSTNGIGCYGTITGTPSPSRSINGCCSGDPHCAALGGEEPAPQDIEDIVASARECACPASQSGGCSSHAGACQYLDELERAASSLGLLPLEQSRGRGGQLLKHTALIIVYNLSMFIGIAFTTWSMMTRDENGVYVEIEFLDVAATYGQALVALALFGLSPGELLVPAARLLKTRWFGSEAPVLPAVEDLSFETRHVCEQFIAHHLERCKAAIAKDTRWRMRSYAGVFRGSCLAAWLVACGLARDRQEAAQYGRHLLDGRLIHHINHQHHFSDSPLLYTFN